MPELNQSVVKFWDIVTRHGGLTLLYARLLGGEIFGRKELMHICHFIMFSWHFYAQSDNVTDQHLTDIITAHVTDCTLYNDRQKAPCIAVIGCMFLTSLRKQQIRIG
jgi:hypothetical protein